MVITVLQNISFNKFTDYLIQFFLIISKQRENEE